MSNFIGDNINAIRVHYGLSQEQLADAIGARQTTVSAWECGDSTPRKSNVEKIIAAIPGLKFDDIMSKEQGFAKTVNMPKHRGFSPVPLYGSVAAGMPIEMIPVEDMKEAPARYVDDDPDCYLVRVHGTSMNRIIHDGSFALVSPRQTEPNERDMFLVTVNGYDATIKHVRKLENGVELVPDSYDPTHRPQVYDFGNDDTPAIRILGKVVWWCKEF
jgi:repressor LexA